MQKIRPEYGSTDTWIYKYIKNEYVDVEYSLSDTLTQNGTRYAISPDHGEF